jgi:hypothetical protein
MNDESLGDGRSDGRAASGDVVPARPAGQGFSGEEWREKARAAQSAQARARRAAAGRYVRLADRGAGARFRAGMARRTPPGGEAG